MIMNEFTVIEYLYRDASNYKVWSEIRLAGVFTQEDVETIQFCMYDGDSFVPQEVGLPPLQPLLWEEFGGPNDDDHDWHSIESIRPATQTDMILPLYGTTDKLVTAFQAVREKMLKQGLSSFFPSIKRESTIDFVGHSQ